MLDDLIDLLGNSLDSDGENEFMDSGYEDFESSYVPDEFSSNNYDMNLVKDIESTSGENVIFRSKFPPNHSTDGYIFQGGEKYKGFDVYKKFGHKYYWDSYKNIFVEIKK